MIGKDDLIHPVFDPAIMKAMGLTKREWFAGMALCGLMASEAWSDFLDKHTTAEWAVSQADALIEVLNND